MPEIKRLGGMGDAEKVATLLFNYGDNYKKSLAENIIESNLRYYFLEEQGAVVGCIAVDVGYGEMKHLVIDPEHRGQHLASQLITKALEDIKSHQGFVWVRTDNDTMQKVISKDFDVEATDEMKVRKMDGKTIRKYTIKLKQKPKNYS